MNFCHYNCYYYFLLGHTKGLHSKIVQFSLSVCCASASQFPGATQVAAATRHPAGCSAASCQST